MGKKQYNEKEEREQTNVRKKESSTRERKLFAKKSHLFHVVLMVLQTIAWSDNIISQQWTNIFEISSKTVTVN